MKATVVNTLVYPWKGLHGIETPKTGLTVNQLVGVEFDRLAGVRRSAERALPRGWEPKSTYKVAANTPRVTLNHGVDESLLPRSPEAAAMKLKGLLVKYGLEGLPVVHTGGKWRLTDTDKAYVSFLNLASVRDLQKALGVEIDPHRFRMNVWVEGMQPWAELDYVLEFERGSSHPMSAGDLKLGCDDVAERCRAINQNPTTGQFDLELETLLSDFHKGRGYSGSPQRGKHNVMGWFAIPRTIGHIKRGDEVILGKAV